ncbi:hypothetical protein LPC08_21735 [Roseomonas sp. OT10]|uniref:hypothetical protein n=1 Tax=Roseomonas cutis TaxID=2897332 RepID=UPI001E4339DF|nr:hypothetical protein [Roseomonas sp. OT10]UFN48602.1 hypothetical protein LPC08_21735 [Roseomonas sp. OT10]
MSRFTASLTAAALALTLGAATAQAHDVLDHSNSASATGSPFVAAVPVTQNSTGASPADDSRSASAVGSAFGTVVPTSHANRGQATDWSNSASATGGVPAYRRAARLG